MMERREVKHWYVENLYSTLCGMAWGFLKAETKEDVSCLRCRQILHVKNLYVPT